MRCICPIKNPSNELAFSELDMTGILTFQARGRLNRPSDHVLCKNHCITSSSRPFVTWWVSKQLLGWSNTGVKLTVGLNLNRVLYSDLFEGCIGIPGWATSSTDRVSFLVMEKVQEEVTGCLKKVRNCILHRYFIDF